MYTESEAKEKACPMGQNIPATIEKYGYCLGPDCMAWRLSYPKQVDGQMIPTGYCGLAGEPKR